MVYHLEGPKLVFLHLHNDAKSHYSEHKLDLEILPFSG